MDFKLFATVFATVFIAEVGDKTQIATFLYAADSRNPALTVFVAAAIALILASGIGVIAGSYLSQYVNPKYLSWAAGIGFILVGIWTILRA
ncbi:MAG: TMEM165/GDT1 family protein [Blastocatellia bacterium]|nr:TMEM165/GDT1 family protein [Blastocatellia bacterium]